jgi:hypothetical protein
MPCASTPKSYENWETFLTAKTIAHRHIVVNKYPFALRRLGTTTDGEDLKIQLQQKTPLMAYIGCGEFFGQ